MFLSKIKLMHTAEMRLSLIYFFNPSATDMQSSNMNQNQENK